MKSLLFDRALLPLARGEVVVIADTHSRLDPGDRPLEFASRRRQTAPASARPWLSPPLPVAPRQKTARPRAALALAAAQVCPILSGRRIERVVKVP